MPQDYSADVKFEIGHVLFINIVGYSKLLIVERDVTCLETDVIGRSNKLRERNIMATKDKSTESVYRVTEVIGTSAQSWEDAAKTAVETAAGTLRDLRIAEVVKMDVKIEDGKVTEYRTRLQLSFKYES
jgi:flavin-binding protein dodecin